MRRSLKKFPANVLLLSWAVVVLMWFCLSQYHLVTTDPCRRPNSLTDSQRLVCRLRMLKNYEGDVGGEAYNPTKGLEIDRGRALLYGIPQTTKGFLTIGISTVQRSNSSYLNETISSLIQKSNAAERQGVMVVIMLADRNATIRHEHGQSIFSQFQPYFEEGFLQLIEAPNSFYPSLDNWTRLTYNDSADRVKWRSKQVVDFAFLFAYVYGQSQYHLILEDDVICENRYLTGIRDVIHHYRDRNWFEISFAKFLIIGKLLPNHILQDLSAFLLSFYDKKPVDLLLADFISLQVPSKHETLQRRCPSLFQHIGIHSSLPNKVQKIKDNTFGLVHRYLSSVATNPKPLHIVTSIKPYRAFFPAMAYSFAPGFFWGIPQENDTFDIVFPSPQHINGIVVLTGFENCLNDSLRNGELSVSSKFLSMKGAKQALCEQFKTVASFINGTAVATNLKESQPSGIQCIRIKVTAKQKTWLVVREIAVAENNSFSNLNPFSLETEKITKLKHPFG